MHWPVSTAHPKRLHVSRAGDGTGRHFGALRGRKGARRRHCGVDLYAYEHDLVRAIAPGKIVRAGLFRSSRTGGLREDGSSWHVDSATVDHGGAGVARYGELKLLPGYAVGSVLEAGEAFATIEKQRSACMLHFELYRPGTRRGTTWALGRPRPHELRDPTALLDSLVIDERARETNSPAA